ncbi:unnamed protein product, partial [Rotaria sp. Silwood2]
TFLLQPIEKFLLLFKFKFNYLLNKNQEFFRLINLKFNKNFQNFLLNNQIKFDTNFLNEYSSTIYSMKIQNNDYKQLYTEKRQLLTQLFKKLTSIGLSFKKGLLNINSLKTFSLLNIDFKFNNIDLNNKIYGFIQIKKKNKFLIDNR